jgi:hypothetical protein
MADLNDNSIESEAELAFNRDDFRLESLEDELRVDGLCKKMLGRFYCRLLAEGMSPEQATLLANGADYFVRDFLVGFKQRSPLDERPGIVRQFAGNWYIVNTLEPVIGEISGYLAGIRAIYRFLRSRNLISPAFLEEIERECSETDYYASRINSFWAITGDGYGSWERECTMKDR